jgi:hypothetical protein
MQFTGNVGMFDWILFDNSKLTTFDDWNVSFLRKKVILYLYIYREREKVEQNINRT